MATGSDALSNVNIDVSRSLDVVALASRAQSEKLREVLLRIDAIGRLNPEGIRNITDVLQAATSNGGCGIGCW